MADAAMAPSDPSGGAEEAEAEEDTCRICHLPAEAERPLRHPCACRGTIRFVHDDCLLRWLATRRTSPSRCEVCKHIISVAPVYAPNAPARLPLPEFMLGLANKLMGWLFLLLSLLFAICVWEFVTPLTTVWVWRLALSRTFAQMRHLLSLRFSVFPGFHDLSSIAPARIAADALAPFALWIARIEAHLQARFGGLDSLQVLALHTVEAALIVVIGDVVFAFALGFLPFSMGRIVLSCISCFSFGNMDVDRSYASTASILLIGYGLIFSLALLFTGLHTFQQYSRGEHLTIAIFFKVLLNCVHWLFTPFRLLPDIHVIVDRTFTFLTHLILWIISLANSSLNLTLILVICPLFFGWSLDISTSKLFGVTIPQKLKLLFGSSYASNALHWVVGCICLKLWPLLSSFLRSVPSLRASFPFVHSAGGQINISSIGKPFYKFYFMMLPDLLYNIIYVAMFILLPVEVVFLLVPTVFPLDVT
ncbi:hypothetical protein PR202_ga30996 [Eleusine coracana subsp. coracana]|uniref:RING-CH-type domain-containing protein n=1 Tax=Eleusine coracana subsp. coracana TaxID=191504 RepID=A0AAV5DQ82_ELECO|nr:hypothetical protein PR202_ga30996 [Eleusine coracana subsp. coracana]